MFFVHRVTDTLAIPAEALAMPTELAVQREIDDRYPGRVWLDIGLVICRYTPGAMLSDSASTLSSSEEDEDAVAMGEDIGPRKKRTKTNHRDAASNNDIIVGPGACVAGTAASHVRTTFSLVVFRPFLEEVCVGTIIASNAQGVQVALGGFFDQIYIPAYWMLRPSSYEVDTGLWVWTPAYDDDEDEEHPVVQEVVSEQETVEEEVQEKTNKKGKNGRKDKESPAKTKGAKKGTSTATDNIKTEQQPVETPTQTAESARYEMEIGSVIRFKVKSIQFARVTQTAKGRQATFSTTMNPDADIMASANATSGVATAAGGSNPNPNMSSSSTSMVRRRSSSVGLDEHQKAPPPMKIMASICEDGLGLVSWWDSGEDEEEDELLVADVPVEEAARAAAEAEENEKEVIMLEDTNEEDIEVVKSDNIKSGEVRLKQESI